MDAPQHGSETSSLHEPLSRTLGSVLEEQLPPEQMTLNALLRRTEERGPYALIVLLCLPFLTPISLPGVSNLLGAVIMVLAVRLAAHLPSRLPHSIGDHVIQPERFTKVVRGSIKVLTMIERIVKPRRSEWLGWHAARIGNAMVIAFMALLLALPIPPTVPLSNMLPAYSILLLAASMMEEDGSAIWLAYGASLITTVYMLAMVVLQAGAIWALWHRYYKVVIQWFQSLL